MPNLNSDTNTAVKPKVTVGRNQRAKDSFVSQAMGARMALLGILPLAKGKRIRDAIFEIGRTTDELAKANGGYLFSTFDEAAKSNEEIDTHGHD